MRWTGRSAAALWALATLFACVHQQPPPAHQETAQMQIKRSRIPAPAVDPIRSNGIRYEQVRNGLLAGFDQMGGYLAAYDDRTGEQLWTLKVYDNKRDPAMEGDVQDVFFKSMTLTSDGRLLIENERGARFVVDPRTPSVEPVS
jgi:outer membrane protein assembly factor BamB